MVECIARNVPAGLGSPVFDKLEVRPSTIFQGVHSSASVILQAVHYQGVCLNLVPVFCVVCDSYTLAPLPMRR